MDSASPSHRESVFPTLSDFPLQTRRNYDIVRVFEPGLFVFLIILMIDSKTCKTIKIQKVSGYL